MNAPPALVMESMPPSASLRFRPLKNRRRRAFLRSSTVMPPPPSRVPEIHATAPGAAVPSVPLKGANTRPGWARAGFTQGITAKALARRITGGSRGPWDGAIAPWHDPKAPSDRLTSSADRHVSGRGTDAVTFGEGGRLLGRRDGK